MTGTVAVSSSGIRCAAARSWSRDRDASARCTYRAVTAIFRCRSILPTSAVDIPATMPAVPMCAGASASTNPGESASFGCGPVVINSDQVAAIRHEDSIFRPASSGRTAAIAAAAIGGSDTVSVASPYGRAWSLRIAQRDPSCGEIDVAPQQRPCLISPHAGRRDQRHEGADIGPEPPPATMQSIAVNSRKYCSGASKMVVVRRRRSAAARQ